MMFRTAKPIAPRATLLMATAQSDVRGVVAGFAAWQAACMSQPKSRCYSGHRMRYTA